MNNYYGYDVAAAVSMYTVERSDYPGVVTERLFRCWRCGNMCPSGSFDTRGSDGQLEDFYQLLGKHVAGEVTACDVCVEELTVRQAVPLTEAAKSAYCGNSVARPSP